MPLDGGNLVPEMDRAYAIQEAAEAILRDEHNVDGGAFGAAAELANTLAARGRRLAAGDFITTGSVTTPVPVVAGQAVVADFGPLGRVELAL